jgi:hypothetical protein
VEKQVIWGLATAHRETLPECRGGSESHQRANGGFANRIEGALQWMWNAQKWSLNSLTSRHDPWLFNTTLKLCDLGTSIMKRIGLCILAIALSAIPFGLGYAIYTGNPIESDGVTLFKLDTDALQDWLITSYGANTTGLGFMIFGIVLAIVLTLRIMTRSDLKT